MNWHRCTLLPHACRRHDTKATGLYAGATMSQAERTRKFRALHQAATPFVIPNPWDIGTARIFKALGFQALATTSAGFANAQGLPDGGITRDMAMQHCREIVNATDLPVSADLENGFVDSPEHVAETIRLAAETGLSGCSIEDASRAPGNPIYDFNLAVERVAAAVEAARALPHDFVLTARAENLLRGRNDLDDTIKRLQAFEKAGADVLYAPALRSAEQIKAVCAAVTKPVNVLAGMANFPHTVDELGRMGVKRISLGSALANAAFGAVIDAARDIQDNGRFTFVAKGASHKTLTDFFTPYA